MNTEIQIGKEEIQDRNQECCWGLLCNVFKTLLPPYPSPIIQQRELSSNDAGLLNAKERLTFTTTVCTQNRRQRKEENIEDCWNCFSNWWFEGECRSIFILPRATWPRVYSAHSSSNVATANPRNVGRWVNSKELFCNNIINDLVVQTLEL